VRQGARQQPLIKADPIHVLRSNQKISSLVLVQSASTAEIASQVEAYRVDWLLEKVSSVSTVTRERNVSLMAIG
jgi:hypothetical protein